MTPSPLPIRLPKGTVACGEILDRYEPEDLDEDIFQAQLPNGVAVDVGWHDDGTPTGVFVVVVFKGNFLNRLAPPQRFKTPRQVVWEVANLAEQFAAPEFASGFAKSKVIGTAGVWASTYAPTNRGLARA